MFAAYYQAFPDLEITPDDMIIDGDHVARATHLGPILTSRPAAPVTACGVNRLVLKDGFVCETLTIWDVAGMLRDMGLLPDL